MEPAVFRVVYHYSDSTNLFAVTSAAGPYSAEGINWALNLVTLPEVILNAYLTIGPVSIAFRRL